MIFVTLGTQKFQLNRLLRLLDGLYEKGLLKEEAFAQIGYSDYKPLYFEYIDFLEKDAFDQKIQESSLVITHSGVGSMIAAVNAGKPTIVFPRLCKYGEHVDDHQLEIAAAFSLKNFVLCCGENDSLQELIVKALTHKFDRYVSSTEHIVEIVREALLI